MKKSIIKFNEKMVNRLIEHWRKQHQTAKDKHMQRDVIVASCYVDAYQTIRVNHNLELLP
jgi:hypothetical protein